jgi:hypothetical protein
VGWEKTTISPGIPDPDKPETIRYPYACLAIMRFFGVIGFSLFSIGTIRFIFSWGWVLPDFWETGNWDIKSIGCFLIALVIGLLGGVLGMNLGAVIPVKSNYWNNLFLNIWHHTANGILVWMGTLGVMFSKVISPEGAIAFIKQGSWPLAYKIFGTEILGTLLIVFVFFLFGQIYENKKPDTLVRVLLAIPVALGMAYYVSRDVAGAQFLDWIISGIFFAYAVVSFSTSSINADNEQRDKILKRGHNDL